MGEDLKAISDFNEAIRRDPAHLNAYLFRGFIWMKLSEFAKAVADFNAVLQLDPTNAKALRGLTSVSEAQKRLENELNFFGNRGSLETRLQADGRLSASLERGRVMTHTVSIHILTAMALGGRHHVSPLCSECSGTFGLDGDRSCPVGRG